jgi:hypothetical protein
VTGTLSSLGAAVKEAIPEYFLFKNKNHSDWKVKRSKMAKQKKALNIENRFREYW